MKKLTIAIGFILFFGILAKAETWDDIVASKKYYYGVGVAATEEEADKAAMADMISQIAIKVSSDFKQIDDITNKNGKIEHQSRVLNCVKTYSQTSLTNAEKWGPEGKAPNITVKRFLRKSELSRIYDNRIAKAKDMLKIADECLSDKKIDMALQHYYWAYSLLRSVQFPDEIKDEKGKILINWLPVKINQILSDINVTYNKKDEDYTYFHFKYKGDPITSIDFSYSDGRSPCQGRAQYGDGLVEMIPGYKTNTYHLDIEYQYISQSKGDAEVESVLNVITPKPFPNASFTINVSDSEDDTNNNNDSLTDVIEYRPITVGFDISSDKTNETDDLKADISEYEAQSKIVNRVKEALKHRQYSNVYPLFSTEGLQMFNRLTGYGKAKVLDDTNIRYYRGLEGRTIARGLKMAFSFSGRRTKTFVEDISFTFDENNKIENVAFGLGEATENGIFNNNAKWTPEVREIITSFMENYKTAYSLERLDYISSIFDDDSVIIVGNVVGKTSNSRFSDGLSLSRKGENIITYNHYTKKDYIEQLAKCFNRNDFINLKFTDHQIQWLEKFNDKNLFAINIRQQYDSSTYADIGYLFLLVDMTNHDEPLIKVRTWQPNEVAIEKLYNAGDFFND